MLQLLALQQVSFPPEQWCWDQEGVLEQQQSQLFSSVQQMQQHQTHPHPIQLLEGVLLLQMGPPLQASLSSHLQGRAEVEALQCGTLVPPPQSREASPVLVSQGLVLLGSVLVVSTQAPTRQLPTSRQ
jgi:hypothetical protein